MCVYYSMFPCLNHEPAGSRVSSLCAAFPTVAVKRKKRKMGMYNLVPKKKPKALKQQEKVGAFICIILHSRPPLAHCLSDVIFSFLWTKLVICENKIRPLWRYVVNQTDRRRHQLYFLISIIISIHTFKAGCMCKKHFPVRFSAAVTSRVFIKYLSLLEVS